VIVAVKNYNHSRLFSSFSSVISQLQSNQFLMI